MKATVLFVSGFVWIVAFGCAPTVAHGWSVVELEDSYIVFFENTLDTPICVQEPSYLFNLLAERRGSTAFEEQRGPAPRIAIRLDVIRVLPGNLVGTRVGKTTIATLQDVESPTPLRFVYQPNWTAGPLRECERSLGLSVSRYVSFDRLTEPAGSSAPEAIECTNRDHLGSVDG